MAKQKTTRPSQSIIDALNFIKPVCKRNGTREEMYCEMDGDFLTTLGSDISMGCVLNSDLAWGPHVFDLLDVFKQINGKFTMTVFDDLGSINFDGLQMTVASIRVDPDEIMKRDDPLRSANNDIKKACSVLHSFVDEKNESAVCHGVFIGGDVAKVTNKSACVEYYHGVDLSEFMISKKAAKILGSVKKDLSEISLSDSVVTFWFSDNSFLRTRLLPLSEQYPSFDDFFSCEEHKPIPNEFFKNLTRMKKFCIGKKVLFSDGVMGQDGMESATATIPEIEGDYAFNVDFLLNFKKSFDRFGMTEHTIEFYGDVCRGVVAKIEDAEVVKE